MHYSEEILYYSSLSQNGAAAIYATDVLTVLGLSICWSGKNHQEYSEVSLPVPTPISFGTGPNKEQFILINSCQSNQHVLMSSRDSSDGQDIQSMWKFKMKAQLWLKL